MLEFKSGQDAIVLVRLVDNLGMPRLGVANTDITASIVKHDGTSALLSPSVGQWTALNTNGFYNSGCYRLTIPAAQVNVLGSLELGVFCNGCQTYIGQYKVIAEENGEIYDQVVIVEGKVDTLQADVSEMLQIEEGRWKIHTTGPDANRLVFYEADGTTVLKKFDLKDSSGNPTTTSVFERVPA